MTYDICNVATLLSVSQGSSRMFQLQEIQTMLRTSVRVDVAIPPDTPRFLYDRFPGRGCSHRVHQVHGCEVPAIDGLHSDSSTRHFRWPHVQRNAGSARGF